MSWDTGAGNPPLQDPWRKLGVEGEFAALQGDDIRVVVLEEDDGVAGAADIPAKVEGLCRAKLSEVELKGGVRVLASGIKLAAFPMNVFLRTNVVALDLSSNKLSQGVDAIGAGGAWLRHLSLANNKLTEFPRLPHLHCLISLDLSYNEVQLEDGHTEGLEQLQVLELSGCGLESLGDDPETTPLRHFRSLRSLNLSENELEDADSLEPLRALASSLEVLTLEENPVSESSAYKKQVKEMLPGLVKLDGDGVRADVRHKAGAINLLADGGSAARMVMEANADNSSCSCIEGNPCTSPPTCLDWKNRYTVARRAREMKGWVPEHTHFQPPEH